MVSPLARDPTCNSVTILKFEWSLITDSKPAVSFRKSRPGSRGTFSKRMDLSIEREVRFALAASPLHTDKYDGALFLALITNR